MYPTIAVSRLDKGSCRQRIPMIGRMVADVATLDRDVPVLSPPRRMSPVAHHGTVRIGIRSPTPKTPAVGAFLAITSPFPPPPKQERKNKMVQVKGTRGHYDWRSEPCV